MTTTSLYQKYRPTNFKDVIGQQSIVETITKQIDSDSIGHAYLFYGTRGLGKTTVARLMAKKLGINNEDLYEIDAASNRGIDDVREIREGVRSQPFSSPYKMYLIDEVHMLTKEAFNALLKTLEEPPKYVIFVLATTELHKVPDTIKSRSQLYVFKNPQPQDLESLLNSVAKKEGADLDNETLATLVARADGSYRDALSQLQMYLANVDGYEQLQDDSDLVAEILSFLIQSDKALDPAKLVASIQLHPDPNILYRSVLKQASDQLYRKVSGESELQLMSSHLKLLLDARGYFNDFDKVLASAGFAYILGTVV